MDTAGKPITCQAAVAWEPKKPLCVETVVVDPPKAHEVRIKVVANGLCRSDLSVIDGNTWNPYEQWPMILGHEGAGIVESVGEGVTDIQPGDHVIALWNPQCKDCGFCKSNKTNQCAKHAKTQAVGLMPDGTTRFTCNGKPIYQFMGLSTLSNYTVVKEISVAKIDPTAPLDKVCVLGCGVPTGYGAALNTAKVEAGSTCAVWGLGAVGLATIMGCRKAGAARIIGVDINPDKFEIAKTFGATEFVNPKDHEQPVEAVLNEMTGGCDFTFECIGNVATMKSAIVATHDRWGLFTMVGVTPATQQLTISPLLVITGRTIKGSIFGGWKGDDVPRLVDDYMKKELMVDEFITHTLPIDKVNEGFDMLVAAKWFVFDNTVQPLYNSR